MPTNRIPFGTIKTKLFPSYSIILMFLFYHWKLYHFFSIKVTLTKHQYNSHSMNSRKTIKIGISNLYLTIIYTYIFTFTTRFHDYYHIICEPSIYRNKQSTMKTRHNETQLSISTIIPPPRFLAQRYRKQFFIIPIQEKTQNTTSTIKREKYIYTCL